MFADAPQLYCEYAAYAPDGRQITDPATLMKLGLQRNYWGNPLGVGVGFMPAPTVDDFGKVATQQEVIDMASPRLRQFPEWESIEVVQSVIGPTDANHVGVVRKERWRVTKEAVWDGGW
jgi:hypothetical protein